MALDVTLGGAQTSTFLTDVIFRYYIRIVSGMMVRRCARRLWRSLHDGFV
jgi:hypothetical protein